MRLYATKQKKSEKRGEKRTAHDGSNTGIDRCLESRKINFMLRKSKFTEKFEGKSRKKRRSGKVKREGKARENLRAQIDINRNRCAIIFLIIISIMLDGGDAAAALNALHARFGHLRREVRIFTKRLEITTTYKKIRENSGKARELRRGQGTETPIIKEQRSDPAHLEGSEQYSPLVPKAH